jgi:ATP-dependent DNA helicase RecQ
MDTPQTAPLQQSTGPHQTPVSLLKKYWGYPAFLPHQESIIASVLSGHDTLAIMATGGGKSLCYQLPALYLGGLTVVISPLIALMKDQVDDLNARGIPAAAFNSTLDYRERTRIEAEMKAGRLHLLFVSPEKCMQAGFLDTLAAAPVRLIAIDEAHCISEWGHNFRPEYRELARFRKLFPSAPVIALTATAIPEVRKDICQQLGLVKVREFVGSFNRENLTYRVVQKKNPPVMLADFLCRHKNEAGIVYCMSKKETEEIAYELRKKGFKALAYHAGLPRPVRADVQDAFLKNSAHIICATVAFGMGIDKPDVRFVIHYDLPKTVESYYQETGRAGRDGKPAECLLFYSRGDYARVRSMLEHDEGGERSVRIALKKLQDMTGYCETTGCRRSFLLSYFGETPKAGNCASCDNCEHPVASVDSTEPARLIALCVQQLPSHFGVELISDVLRGKKSAKIESYHFDRLPAYASGKNYSKEEYRAWINDLVRQGYLARTGDKYPVIALGAKSSGLLAGTCRVRLPAPVRDAESDAPSAVPEPEVVDSDAREAEAELFQRLKAVRTSVARENRVPPYVVFADRSLRVMARVRPCDRAHFATIPGVGSVKQEKYGPVFLEAIRAYCSGPAD